MRGASIVLSLILGFAVETFAGNVYGSIKESNKPVARGVPIEITCGSSKHDTQTDDNGSFKVFVSEKGKCTLKVSYQGQMPSIDINSYDGSVQYDLILQKQGTQYTLKRM